MKEYELSPYGTPEKCPNVDGKFIGSAGCTAKCEHCSDYKTDDYHDRIDVIRFTCNFKNK